MACLLQSVSWVQIVAADDRVQHTRLQTPGTIRSWDNIKHNGDGEQKSRETKNTLYRLGE